MLGRQDILATDLDLSGRASRMQLAGRGDWTDRTSRACVESSGHFRYRRGQTPLRIQPSSSGGATLSPSRSSTNPLPGTAPCAAMGNPRSVSSKAMDIHGTIVPDPTPPFAMAGVSPLDQVANGEKHSLCQPTGKDGPASNYPEFRAVSNFPTRAMSVFRTSQDAAGEKLHDMDVKLSETAGHDAETQLTRSWKKRKTTFSINASREAL